MALLMYFQLKITHEQPLPDRIEFKILPSEISSVKAYIGKLLNSTHQSGDTNSRGQYLLCNFITSSDLKFENQKKDAEIETIAVM